MIKGYCSNCKSVSEHKRDSETPKDATWIQFNFCASCMDEMDEHFSEEYRFNEFPIQEGADNQLSLFSTETFAFPFKALRGGNIWAYGYYSKWSDNEGNLSDVLIIPEIRTNRVLEIDTDYLCKLICINKKGYGCYTNDIVAHNVDGSVGVVVQHDNDEAIWIASGKPPFYHALDRVSMKGLAEGWSVIGNIHNEQDFKTHWGDE